MAELLASSLAWHASRNPDDTKAREVLAESFALAFPNLAELASYDMNAQGFLVGFAHGGALKAYFHTRLQQSSNRERVLAVLKRSGVNNTYWCDALSEETPGRAFRGVGVDLDSRCKIYVRILGAKLLEQLPQLMESSDCGWTKDQWASQREACLGWIRNAQHGVADHVELAVSMSGHSPPTLKITLFNLRANDNSHLIKILQEHAPQKVITACTDALGLLGEGSLHGLGCEFTPEGPSKLNVYMQVR
jgi:hypothetical protein